MWRDEKWLVDDRSKAALPNLQIVTATSKAEVLTLSLTYFGKGGDREHASAEEKDHFIRYGSADEYIAQQRRLAAHIVTSHNERVRKVRRH